MRNGYIRSIVILGVVAAAAVGIRAAADDPYQVTFVMPSADATFVGAMVKSGGHEVGEVTDVGVRDGRAVVTVQIDDDHSPLSAGTKARITWESLIGARIVELLPGDRSAPPLESGRLITGSAVEPVELDNVLATLDGPTRKNVEQLVGQLDELVKGEGSGDLNGLLRSAAPMADGAAEIVKAVGSDGAAINELVDQLHVLLDTAADRRGALESSIDGLHGVASTMAARQKEISATLEVLPRTVRNANSTLAAVPKPVGKAKKLLGDLRPTTERLPAVAEQLAPAMRDLRPAIAELRPTLSWSSQLLQYTPGLLTSAADALPGATSALAALEPMTTFLRPYTPELAGWLTNWTSIFGSQAASGNYARALITVGGSSFNDNPGIFVPGQRVDETPAPGSIVGQAWDANGDEMR